MIDDKIFELFGKLWGLFERWLTPKLQDLEDFVDRLNNHLDNIDDRK